MEKFRLFIWMNGIKDKTNKKISLSDIIKIASKWINCIKMKNKIHTLNKQKVDGSINR